jgi:hypothetical protein
VLSSLLWGSSFVSIKIGLSYLNAFEFAFLRMGLSVVVLFVVFVPYRKISKALFMEPTVWALGLLGANRQRSPRRTFGKPGGSHTELVLPAGQGKSILIVSHSMDLIKGFCEKTLYLLHGEIRSFGPGEETTGRYIEGMKTKRAISATAFA